MASPRVITGVFPVPKANPYTSQGAWVGFQVEANPTMDLVKGEVRGYQGRVRAWPVDPKTYAPADSSDPFVVTLTTAADAVNATVGGDVASIKAILDARIAASGIVPVPVYAMGLNAGTVGVTYSAATVTLIDADLDAILTVVLRRAKVQNTMGTYDDPAWPVGSSIVMKVNGVAV